MSTIKEYFDSLRGESIAVISMGVSNTPLIKMMLRAGLNVTVCDKSARERVEEQVAELESLGANFQLGPDYLQKLYKFDVIFRTPGLSPNTPELKEAAERGAEITSEMELFFDLCPAKIFAITGSDGKTTTTTLTYKLLEAEAKKEGKGRNVYVGGNIGAPLLPLVDTMTENDYAVVELSSFQLMTMTKSAWSAAITNVTPNHLNWHTDMEEYTVSKYNVYRHGAKRVVLNADNDLTAALIGETGADETVFSLAQNADICETDGYITVKGEKYLKVSDIKIPGRFNVANYMCAIGITEGLVSKETITEVAKTFGGVEHRNEFVREVDGVKYYNSSIDSSPARTMAALSSYPTKPILICCGRDKHVPFDEMAEDILKKAKALVLSGEARDKIYAAMQNAGCGDFKIIIDPNLTKR